MLFYNVCFFYLLLLCCWWSKSTMNKYLIVTCFVSYTTYSLWVKLLAECLVALGAPHGTWTFSPVPETDSMVVVPAGSGATAPRAIVLSLSGWGLSMYLRKRCLFFFKKKKQQQQQQQHEQTNKQAPRTKTTFNTNILVSFLTCPSSWSTGDPMLPLQASSLQWDARGPWNNRFQICSPNFSC